MLVERRIHGTRMYLDTNDPGQSRELLENGSREGDCPYILSKIVQKGWTCLDLGASLGFYVFIEAQQGAKVHAIEANPSNVRILRRSVALNTLDIEVHHFAAGNKTGEARFMQHQKSNRGYMLDMTANRPGGVKEVVIKELPLDEFGIVPNLLRFDIDGYEKEMIEGAVKTIESMPPDSWIFAELHPRCFDNPVKDLCPALEFVIGCGFVPRTGVGPGKELAKVPASDFAVECCTTFKETAPLVFLEKCG